MEIIFIATASSLLAFMVLATYDGFYLHLWKYRLYNREESKFEHLTHTVRAILFPAIVLLLLVNQSNFNMFLAGIALAILDFVVLALDANSEDESRKFMGGLPKREYILHLFSNAFHYGVVILALVMKIRITGNTIHFVNNLDFSSFGGQFLLFVANNAIPGALILALLHILLSLNKSRAFLDHQRMRVTCC